MYVTELARIHACTVHSRADHKHQAVAESANADHEVGQR